MPRCLAFQINCHIELISISAGTGALSREMRGNIVRYQASNGTYVGIWLAFYYNIKITLTVEHLHLNMPKITSHARSFVNATHRHYRYIPQQHLYKQALASSFPESIFLGCSNLASHASHASPTLFHLSRRRTPKCSALSSL